MWLVSPLAASSRVTSAHSPPDAATRRSGPRVIAPYRITLSRFHVPPLPLGPGNSHSVVGCPPDNATSFNLEFPWPCAKKAIERLSGDQNGNAAPSLPS